MIDAKTIVELLARIEKLPEEWRHPRVSNNLDGSWLSFGSPPPSRLPIDDSIALDLHLRTIAERLAESGVAIDFAHGKFLYDSHAEEAWIPRSSYADCLISAAEEVSK